MASTKDSDTLSNSQILTIIIGVILGVLVIYFFYIGYINTDCITKIAPIDSLGLGGIRMG